MILRVILTTTFLAMMVIHRFQGCSITQTFSAVAFRTFKLFIWINFRRVLAISMWYEQTDISNYRIIFYSILYLRLNFSMLGTCLGFSPGTFGIVYAGTAGKDLFSGTGGFPWYFYVLGAIVVAAIGGTISNIASAALENISCDGEDIDDISL